MGLQPKVGGEFLLNLNICKIPIDEKYREGLMKRTLKRELKSLIKLLKGKRWKPVLFGLIFLVLLAAEAL